MFSQRPKSKAERIVVEELNHAAKLTQEAILSGGWYYPLYGVAYLLSHPSLFRSIAPLVLKCVATSISITLGTFTVTYIPQVAFCALFSGPLAPVAAFTLVLGESYAVILFVTKIFFLGQMQDKIFDAVLIQQGHEGLISRSREVKSGNTTKTLGRSITRPLNRFNGESILRYIISLPLNTLPIVGTILFLLYNGSKAGPGFHARYFQLRGLSASERADLVHRQRGAYTAFGAIALALNLVPLVGLVFTFTSTIGAALWASALEKKNINASSS